MTPNLIVLLAASVIPFVFAYAWFHPSVFGGETWYNVAKLSGADRNEVSKLKLFSTLLFNVLIAFGLYNLCVHSMGAFGMVGADTALLKTGTGGAFMAEYGQNGLNFGHGAFHGLTSTLFMVVPVLAYVTIFEKKSIKYFFVYTGYWAISLMLMGGVLCQWGTTAL